MIMTTILGIMSEDADNTNTSKNDNNFKLCLKVALLALASS